MKIFPPFRQTITDLPIPRKLALIMVLFCAVIFANFILSYGGMEILSGSRAYVGGEGLWSKSQKQAVLRMGRYVWSHNENEYLEYLAALEIPLGDRQARLELEKAQPNLISASTGLLRGGNNPKDIPSMIHLFLWFRHVSYMKEAIDIWRQGDAYIATLQTVGDQIHHEMVSHRSSLRRLELLLSQVQDINSQLTPLENAFSSTLGAGARWMNSVLLTAMLILNGAFLTVILVIAFLISHHLCAEIDQLRSAAARFAGGDMHISLDLDSRDEIGDLARSFQQMVAERRKIELLKEELYANVLAANQELEAFSYSVSHDLRAPLRAIDGFSQELLQNSSGVLDARGQKDLGRIRAATQRMAQLIDDLLELSRLARSEFQSVKFDLSAVVMDIVQDLQKSDPARSVEWVIAPEVIVEGDPHLLRIAFQNLIQNAWKFTQRQARSRIEFGTTDAEPHKTVFIKDNGVGFNMTYAGKLFKPFQRLHDSKEFPGTGIGLALVQRIVHRHSGTIRALAEENRGAAFYITLPSADARFQESGRREI